MQTAAIVVVMVAGIVHLIMMLFLSQGEVKY